MVIERLTENSVREAPMSGARLQAADFGAEIRGRALEGFGKQMSQVAKEVDEVVYKYDLAAAKNADNEDATELARVRAEALTAVGEDAPKAAEAARTAARDIKARRLENESMKGRRGQLYGASFDQRMVEFETQLVNHTVKQADVAERGAAEAAVAGNIKRSVDAYADPVVFKAGMDEAFRNYKIAQHGMTEKQIEVGWRGETTKAHVAIVGNMLITDSLNPHRAMDWFDDHREELTPEGASIIQAKLAPHIALQDTHALGARTNDEGITILNGGTVDYSKAGEDGVTPPPQGALPPPEVGAALVDAAAPPGAAPEGVDKVAPVSSGSNYGGYGGREGKPAELPKPAPSKLYNNSKEVFSAVLGGEHYDLTNTAAQHEARGSGKAVDLAGKIFTRIHPPMSGRVVKAWNDTVHGGGFSVLVEHDNGYTTGYAHLAAMPKVKDGDRVEKGTTLGLMGASGTKAHGVHLHFTVRKTGEAGRLDPQTVQWSAMGDSGGPPVVEPSSAPWKEAGVVMIAEGDAAKDTGVQLIARLNAVARERERQGHGFSQTEYDALAELYLHQAAKNDQMYKAGYDKLWERVQGEIAALEEAGTPFTSTSQIAEYGQLEGGHQLRVAGMAAAGRKSLETGEDLPTGSDRYFQFYDMAHSLDKDPSTGLTGRETFLKHSFRTEHTLPPSERKEFAKMQTDMREKNLSADMDQVTAMVDRYTGYTDKQLKTKNSPQAKARSKLIWEVETTISRRQAETGQPLTSREKNEIVMSSVVKMAQGNKEITVGEARATGPGGKITAVNGVPKVVDIPKVFETIPRSLKDQYIEELLAEGENPSPRNIVLKHINRSRPF